MPSSILKINPDLRKDPRLEHALTGCFIDMERPVFLYEMLSALNRHPVHLCVKRVNSHGFLSTKGGEPKPTPLSSSPELQDAGKDAV